MVDYSGFATSEVARVYKKYVGLRNIETIADRLGSSSRKLRMVVNEERYPFVGLTLACELLEEGLNLDVPMLIESGELTIIPSGNPNASRRMVEDMVWVSFASDPSLTNDEVDELTAQYLKSKSEEVAERASRLDTTRKQLLAA